MDLAIAIFNIGAGFGILAVGVAVAYLAAHLVPLVRETRALAVDARRVTQLLDTELRPILAGARELTANVEVLSEDAAVKLDRLTDLMNAIQGTLESVQITAAPRHASAGPVESWNAQREDE